MAALTASTNPPEPRLLELLEESHSRYHGRSAQEVTQLRVPVLLALARDPLPELALPFVLEELDTGLDPHLVAAAAIALRSYPQPNPAFEPFLRRALDNIRAHDDLISFEKLDPDPASDDCTSPVRELMRTAAWLGIELQQQPAGEASDCCSLVADPGRILRSRRTPKSISALIFEDQRGTTASYRDLFTGHPTVVVFFYTRCDNPLKCSLTIWKLARLQKLLDEHGAGEQVHTAAITYDSDFDTPDLLNRFGRNRGVKMNAAHRLMRVQGGIEPLRAHFQLGVGFFDGLVNRHRIELFLLDGNGCVVTSRGRLRWEEEEVRDQAIKLLREPVPALSFAGSAAAVGLALLPKCPLCWAAWLSAAGITSLNTVPLTSGIQFALVALLALNLFVTFSRTRTTRNYFPLALTAAGSACLPANTGIGTMLILLGAIASSFGKRPLSWSFVKR